jgi:hypothetical protein
VVDLDLLVAGRVEVAVDLPAWPEPLEPEPVALVDDGAMRPPDVPASALRRGHDATGGQRRGDDPPERRERAGDLDADLDSDHKVIPALQRT